MKSRRKIVSRFVHMFDRMHAIGNSSCDSICKAHTQLWRKGKRSRIKSILDREEESIIHPFQDQSSSAHTRRCKKASPITPIFSFVNQSPNESKERRSRGWARPSCRTRLTPVFRPFPCCTNNINTVLPPGHMRRRARRPFDGSWCGSGSGWWERRCSCTSSRSRCLFRSRRPVYLLFDTMLLFQLF